MKDAAVPVWSARIRAGHWALAACVLVCLWLFEGGPWHERLGYAALLLAAWRTSLGWLARAAHLRFAAFVRRPEPTWAYARAALARREARHLGHNPLGGWMILALLGAALIAGASGALYATDAFWGDPTLYALHQVSGWSFALLIPLHVGGVVLTSILQRENLIAAMVTGRKRAPAPGDTGLG